MDVTFGRLEPKERAHEQTYSFAGLAIPTARDVEANLLLPGYDEFYDQDGEGRCVGASESWMMSIYNKKKYDARWLYKMAQQHDNNPFTDPAKDTGTYVWAGMWCLEHLGHKIFEGEVSRDEGIRSYYWGQNADHFRTALALGRPAVFGINWYEDFMTPTMWHNEWWIGIGKGSLGKRVGGHAICAHWASDTRQAGRLIGTWHKSNYPPVWIAYELINKLLSEGGEMCVAIDKPDLPY